MTTEKYPTIKELEILIELINKYFLFIKYLKVARRLSENCQIVADTISLFNIVKVDDNTIKELKKWKEELIRMKN